MHDNKECGLNSQLKSVSQVGMIMQERQGEVPRWTQQIDGALKEHENLLSQLESRLESVVGPEVPQQEEDCPERCVHSELGRKLHAFTTVLNVMNGRLSSLITRMEL